MGVVVPYWRSLIKTGVGAFRGGMTEVMTGPIADYVRESGAAVRLNSPVRALLGDSDRITGVRTDEGDIVADHVVVATSLGPAKELIDSALANHTWFDNMRSLQSTPFCSQRAVPLLSFFGCR